VTIGEESNRFKTEGFRYVIKTPKRSEPEPVRTEKGGIAAGTKPGSRRAGGGGKSDAQQREDQPYAEDLFEALRVLRRKLADAADVPAFVVFSDAALRDMCRVMPKDEASFLSVSGVGQAKLAQYGDAFLSEIKAWRGA
jgi:ATP-dependent DNA helicase RecQ